MFTVKECLTDIYQKMGNLSKTQVDLSVVLSRFYSVINRRLAQMNLSTNNWILDFIDVEDSNEFYNVLSAANFSNAVSVELVDFDSENTIGIPIEIVNPINITVAREQGKRAIGFYQNATTRQWQYVTTFKDFQGKLKIWFEPNSPVPAGINNSIKIKDMFKDLLTTETAYFLMDYAKRIAPQTLQGIKQSLREDYLLWDAEWTEELQKGRQLKSVRRTPFRAGF